MPKGRGDTSGRSPAPAVDDVEDLLGVAGDNTHRIRFWRKGSDGTRGYLGQLEPAKLRGDGIRETVRARWGGGEFTARVRHINGTWGQSRTFAIEGEPVTPRHGSGASDRGDDPGDARERRRRRRGFTMHPLVEQVLVPVAVAFGGMIVKKMMEDPKTDPMLLELIKRGGRGDGMNPLELQRLVMDAERRGEQRGAELGEMRAQLEAGPAGGGEAASQSGVVAAVREAAGAVKDIVSYARGRSPSESPNEHTDNPPARELRIIRPTPAADAGDDAAASGTAAGEPMSSSSAEIPPYLRELAGSKEKLLWAADLTLPVSSVVNVVVERSSDEQWAAIVDSFQGKRLRAELLAAVPELEQNDGRRAYVTQLLEELGRAIEEISKAPPAKEASGA